MAHGKAKLCIGLIFLLLCLPCDALGVGMVVVGAGFATACPFCGARLA